MVEYKMSVLVGGLSEEPEPYTGDFEGETEYNESENIYVFDGSFTDFILANSEGEARELFCDAVMNANWGDLKEIGFDKANITLESENSHYKRTEYIRSSETGMSNSKLIMTNNFKSLGDYEMLYNFTGDALSDRPSDSSLMKAVDSLADDVWTDSHLSECAISLINRTLYVELLNEYDEETAANNEFSPEDLYQAVLDKARELGARSEFKDLVIIVGDHIGTNDLYGQLNHELIVLIPTATTSREELKQQVETIASILDNEAYNLRSPLELAKTASDLKTISANEWQKAGEKESLALQKNFKLVPLYDYMKENCDNAAGDISDELLDEDPNIFFDLEDKEYDMGDTEEENYNYTEECNKEIADTSHEIAAELNEYNPLVAIDHDGNTAATLLFEKDGEIYLPKEIYLPSLPENGSRMYVDVEIWNAEEDKTEVRTESFRAIDSQIPFKEILNQIDSDLGLPETQKDYKKKYSQAMEIGG